MDITERYFEGHNKSGLKVGDRVKVLRKAESGESNWDNTWCHDMDKYVNKIYIITHDFGCPGFQLNTVPAISSTFSFPYFVLKKVGLNISLTDDLFQL